MGDLDIGERIILKWVLRKSDLWVWIGLIRLKTRYSNETFLTL